MCFHSSVAEVLRILHPLIVKRSHIIVLLIKYLWQIKNAQCAFFARERADHGKFDSASCASSRSVLIYRIQSIL